MYEVDYLIIGSGLTGSVIARLLKDAGRETIVIERRNHVGGNVHDHTHACGIRIHTYGPHYFRTSSQKIWDFCNRFSSFYSYIPKIITIGKDETVNWPLGISYIRSKLNGQYRPDFVGSPTNFEEAALSLMPREIYETFVKEYNEKQWGIPAALLSTELCKRFNVRMDDDPRLTPDAKYQGIPSNGYHAWMSKMLSDIPVILNCDILTSKMPRGKRYTIYTGPIDEFFSCDMGKLKYRGQKRHHKYLPHVNGYHQSCGQVNNPRHDGGDHIRTLEWKHMMRPEYARRINGSVITKEIPYTPVNSNDYEYPFPDDTNVKLYHAYRQRADAIPDTIICGRLGEYRYYDMDQAIGRAMIIAEKIIKQT